MTIEEVLQHFGSSYRLEVQTGILHQNVVYWKRCGCIPLTMQYRLNELTKGKLKIKLRDGL